VLLGVREAEGRSPRAAEQQPPLDAEQPSEFLEIPEQVLGRVGAEVDLRVGGVRRTAAGAALVEQHHPVRRGVEEASPPGPGARSRAAVEDDRRLPGRVAADLPMHEVPVADVEQPLLVRLDLRIHELSLRKTAKEQGGRPR
jgi:hypothetical protein